MTLATIPFIISLLLCSQAFAQSALQPFVSADTASCLERSVTIYTSNALTYIVTDVGSFVSSAPSSCPAATTLPAVISISCPDSAYVGLDNVAVVSSATGSTDDNVQWQIQCDTDHIWGDMTNVVTTDLLDCVIACDNYGPACLGVAWVAAGEEQTTCFLKSAITDPDTPTPPLSVDAAIRLYYRTTTTTTTTSTPASAITLNPAVPVVALASPTAIAGSLQGSPYNYDDNTWPVTLPFAIGVYGQTSSTVQVSSNGVSSFFGSSVDSGCTNINRRLSVSRLLIQSTIITPCYTTMAETLGTLS